MERDNNITSKMYTFLLNSFNMTGLRHSEFIRLIRYIVLITGTNTNLNGNISLAEPKVQC